MHAKGSSSSCLREFCPSIGIPMISALAPISSPYFVHLCKPTLATYESLRHHRRCSALGYRHRPRSKECLFLHPIPKELVAIIQYNSGMGGSGRIASIGVAAGLMGLGLFGGANPVAAIASISVPDPISFYKFDQETGAASLVDSIRGAAGEGRFYSYDPTTPEVVSGTGTFAPGRIGNALCFDADEKEYSAAPLIGNGLTEFTISAWVKLDSFTNWGSVAKNWGVSEKGSFHLGLDEGTDLKKFSSYIGLDDGSQRGVEDKDNERELNTWYHLVTTASTANGELKLYVDGSQVGTTQPFSGTIAQAGNLMSFGVKLEDDYDEDSPAPAGSFPGYLDGCVDEIAFWDEALSSTQISQIFNDGEDGESTIPDGSTPEEVTSNRESATQPDQGEPGIFLTVTGRAGDLFESSEVIYGAYSIAPNSSYQLSVQSISNPTLVNRVLASGRMSSGGHLESTARLPLMEPSLYRIVFEGVAAGGEYLRLTNHVSVDALGRFSSVSSERLQPVLN